MRLEFFCLFQSDYMHIFVCTPNIWYFIHSVCVFWLRAAYDDGSCRWTGMMSIYDVYVSNATVASLLEGFGFLLLNWMHAMCHFVDVNIIIVCLFEVHGNAEMHSLTHTQNMFFFYSEFMQISLVLCPCVWASCITNERGFSEFRMLFVYV